MPLPDGWDHWTVPKSIEINKGNRAEIETESSRANNSQCSPVSSTSLNDCLDKICTAKTLSQPEGRVLRPRPTQLVTSSTYDCSSCPAKFKRWESYYIHAKFKCLKKAYGKRFACPLCLTYSSNVRAQLAKHIVLQHVSKPDLSDEALFN